MGSLNFEKKYNLLVKNCIQKLRHEVNFGEFDYRLVSEVPFVNCDL